MTPKASDPPGTLITEPTQENVTAAVYCLQSAGLYAKASDPLDWERATTYGKPPQLIRGGTHVEKTPDLNVVHGSFTIEWKDQTYEVQGEAHPPARFNTLTEASQHITRYWKPVGKHQPLRRG